MCSLAVTVLCLAIHVSPKEPLGIKLPFLVFMWTCVQTLELLCRATLSCEHAFEESPTSQEYSKMWWRDHTPPYKESCWQAIASEIRRPFQKKAFCNCHVSGPSALPIVISNLSMILPYSYPWKKMLLCAEWSVSLSSFSMKCKAVSSNIGYSDSFPWKAIFMIVHGTIS